MITKMKKRCQNKSWACSFLFLECHKISILYPLCFFFFKKTKLTTSGLTEFNRGAELEQHWKSWNAGKAKQSKGEQCRKPLLLPGLQDTAGRQCQQSSGFAYGDLDPRKKVQQAGARVMEEMRPLSEKPVKEKQAEEKLWLLCSSCSVPKAGASHSPNLIGNQIGKGVRGIYPAWASSVYKTEQDKCRG